MMPGQRRVLRAAKGSAWSDSRSRAFDLFLVGFSLVSVPWGATLAHPLPGPDGDPQLLGSVRRLESELGRAMGALGHTPGGPVSPAQKEVACPGKPSVLFSASKLQTAKDIMAGKQEGLLPWDPPEEGKYLVMLCNYGQVWIP